MASKMAKTFSTTHATTVCYHGTITIQRNKMIHQILKKEYDQIRKARKRYPKNAPSGFIIFKGEDGKYYRCDKSGGAGMKEMVEFNRGFRASIDNQTALI